MDTGFFAVPDVLIDKDGLLSGNNVLLSPPAHS